VRRAEVWWATPQLVGESRKRRPVLVISEDLFHRNARYLKVMAVHLTSVRHLGGPFAWEVDLPKGAAGLAHSSVVKCAEIFTLEKSQLASLIGTLSPDLMRRVDRALAIALSLPYPRSDD
jgi:mRNA interferase MazF